MSHFTTSGSSPPQISISPAPSWFRVTTVFKYGGLGVAVFVVVSGYCLMLPVVSDPGLRLRGGVIALRQATHAANHPPVLSPRSYSRSVVLGLFSELREPTGTPQDITLPTFTWPKTLTHVFVIHNWSRDWRWGINPPHWTVALEFQI